MIKNYFKIAIRNFSRDKSFTIVNLVSLSIGLASVIMILAYVRYELSYDEHYSNSDRIFRIIEERTKGGIKKESVVTNEGLTPALKREFPEVEAASGVTVSKTSFLSKGNPISVNILNTDSNFFKIFNIPFVYGNPKMCLYEKYSIVITEKIARTYFSNRNPIGEKLNSGRSPDLPPFTITGVIKDIPANTHFKADAIVATNPKYDDLNYKGYSSVPQYLLLKPHINIQQLEHKLNSFYSKYDFPEEIKIRFQPITSIHLHSNASDEPFVNSDIRYIYIFSTSAFLILLIACINYVNLTTARGLKRVREVGVRKVLGAERKQLIIQFTCESFLFFFSSLPVSLLLANLFWPFFTRIVNIEAEKSYLISSQNILLILFVSVISGIVSGLYPSFFLSRLQPAAILQDWQKSFKVNLGIRKTLIVLQFVITITLIVSTIIIYRQLTFLDNKPLGFNKENLIVLPFSFLKNHGSSFKNELLKNSNIKSVTTASWNVGELLGGSATMDNPKDSTKEFKFNFVDADFDFLKTIQIELSEGRNFSIDYPSDMIDIDSLSSSKKYSYAAYLDILASHPIIISEKVVNTLGLKEPAGQILRLPALQGTVIGVIKDFNGLSLHQQTSPVVIRARPVNDFGYIYIRLNPTNIKTTLDYIQNKWKTYFPASAFDFSFVDERLQQLYDSERRMASLFTVFATLAICIACAGLFSIVALIVQQRTKEIGIRKVLGANVIEIVKLITKDFVALIAIAVVIASPVAWYGMNKWLQDFAYRINISWWFFLFAGALTIGIAVITISFQAIKAAIANPVKSLRSE